MSSVSYFQRYSQRENHVTNNTLLMFRHLYRSSPAKFQEFLSRLVDDIEIPIGLEFVQQERGSASVPDGTIRQESLSIDLEVKRGGSLDFEQVKRHIKTIKNRPDGNTGIAILVVITSTAVSTEVKKKLAEEGKAVSITVLPLTFQKIVEQLEGSCREFETDLQDVLSDYKDYLRQEGLLDTKEFWMASFPCGQSWQENIKYHVYYEPVSRSSVFQVSAYIGIYHQKKISHIGKIVATAVAGPNEDGDSLVIRTEDGTLSSMHEERIQQIIDCTPYYSLAEYETRYYVVDQFEETSFEKKSNYGQRGRRYFNLTEYKVDIPESGGLDAVDVAEQLQGKTWE